MAIKDCCRTNVVCCDAGTTVPDVAALMRTHHVGDVVVVAEQEGKRVPLGIVTDRDIVLEAVAVGLHVEVFTAGDMMSSPMVTVQTDEGVLETLRIMSQHRVRRLVVVRENGALHGIVTSDDLINLLATELSLLADALVEQPAKEARIRK